MLHRIELVLLSIVLSGFMVGCGSTQQIASGDTPSPPATATLTPTPTPESTPPLTIDPLALTPYIHPTKFFSLDYPDGWQLFEQSNGVIIVDPATQTGYTVVFDNVGEVYSKQELQQYLVTFIAKNFAGKGSDFKAIGQAEQADGSIVAQFSTLDAELGPSVNHVKILQQESLVFLVFLSTSEAHWTAAKTELQQLTETFAPGDVALPTSQPTPSPPAWTLIGPNSKEFGFLYASNWLVQEQEENSVTVSSPEQDFFFTASNFALSGARDEVPVGAATSAALAYVDGLGEEYDDVQSLPPAEFRLDTASGTTIDFLYTNENEGIIAGSVITAVANGKMHRVVFTAPAELYDLALEWFNPMYQSFKFLAPEDGLPSEDE